MIAKISWSGVLNGISDPTETERYEGYLQEMATKIVSDFQAKTYLRNMLDTIIVPSGKDAVNVPLIGDMSGAYHTPGADIFEEDGILNNSNYGRVRVEADGEFVAAVNIETLDELRDPYPGAPRARYEEILRETLTRKFEMNALMTLLNASILPSPGAGFAGGKLLKNPLYATQIDKLVEGIANAKTIFDNQGIPNEDRYCFLDTALATALSMQPDLIDKNLGGDGSIANGYIGKLLGFDVIGNPYLSTGAKYNIVKVNPKEVNTRNDYSGDFSNYIGVCFHKKAVVNAEQRALKVDFDKIPQRRISLLQVAMAVGHKAILPGAVVGLSKASA